MEIKSELLRSLGMTLVHSVWEGLVVLILVLLALSLAGRSNARLRYVILVSGHVLLLAGFIATWFIVYNHNMASAMAPLKKVYSQVNLMAGATPLTLHTANYATVLNRFLEPFYPALAIGWTLGLTLLALRMAGGLYISYNRLKKDLFLPDPSLLDLFEKAKSRLVIPVTVGLRMTTRQISPLVIGIIKPMVIVPVSILSGLNPEQAEAILIHELAHIRRYDHLLIILQAIITRILFFHPVAWYLSGEIDRERENCCDDLVVKAFPNPINYIKALAMIQDQNTAGHVPANALLGRPKRLLDRVKRLLKTEKRHTPLIRMTAMFLLLISLGMAAVAVASATHRVSGRTIEEWLSAKPEQTLIYADTSKAGKHGKPVAERDSVSKENGKKQKEMDEASRKLEKAHEEFRKAQAELHQAREEYMRARQMQEKSIAELYGLPAPILSDEERLDWLRLEENLQELMKNKEELFHFRPELWQHDSMGFKHPDPDVWRLNKEEWEKQMQEWRLSEMEMNKQMRELMKQDWQFNMEMFDPVIPDAPLPPDFEIPEPPDPETENMILPAVPPDPVIN